MNPPDLKSSYYIVEPRAKRFKTAIGDHAKTESPKRNFYFQHIGLAREGLRKKFGEDAVSKFLDSKK